MRARHQGGQPLDGQVAISLLRRGDLQPSILGFEAPGAFVPRAEWVADAGSEVLRSNLHPADLYYIQDAAHGGVRGAFRLNFKVGVPAFGDFIGGQPDLSLACLVDVPGEPVQQQQACPDGAVVKAVSGEVKLGRFLPGDAVQHQPFDFPVEFCQRSPQGVAVRGSLVAEIEERHAVALSAHLG